MDSSNIVQLVVPQSHALERRDQIQGPDREAEFLSLKLVNKRGRVRLSPAGFDYNKLPGKSSLLAVGNKKGWFAAAIRKEDNNYILVSNLSELQTAFESGQLDPEPFIPFTARCSPFSVPGTPIILKFALNDERLVVGFLEGPILIYATNDLSTLNQGDQVNPIFSLPGDASTMPRDILPNPGETPELVAIMRGVHGQEPGHHIDVIDVRELKHVVGWRKGPNPNVAPVSISWSPKGKQIAIGLQSGEMLLYSPVSPGSPKSHLFKARSTPDDGSSLLSMNWLLSPTTFYNIYSTPEASSTLFDPSTMDAPTHAHFISAHDSKAKYAVDVALRDPCPPFGARRAPGPLVVVLRNWSPTRFIIFCGGGPSSDIGVVGTLPSPDPSKPGDQWGNFSLEETSTASLPLDDELNDLTLLGLEVDLTSSKPIRMSEQPDDGTPDLPPSPILYAYTNDGTVIAWHVLNNSGEPYPGMNVVPASQAPQQKENAQVFGTSSPRMSPTPQDTASVFNQTPASSSSPPASAFGQAAPPPSSPAAPAQGFGAFANVNTSSHFGSTGFGFGGGSAPPNSGGTSSTPTFGSTSFGSGNTINPAPSPSFGTTGFGGAGTNQTALQKPPSSAFGTTGFGQASAAPVFGVSAFGSKPAAPAFGQSGFGITPSGVAKPASTFGSTGGGFASYATTQGNSTSNASSPSPSAFGQAAFGQTSSPLTSTSAFGAGGQGQASSPVSAFGSGGVGQALKATSSTSAFGQQESKPQSTFGTFRDSGSGSAFARTGSSRQDSGGLDGSGGLGDALGPSPPAAKLRSPQGSPPSPTDSLPESPELQPTSLPAKPISSYLKPAEGFGTLKKSESLNSFGGAEKATSPSPKPAGGFGSISQPNLPSSANEQKPTTSSMAPTFGSPSVLGPPKPIFGSSSFGTRSAAEPAKPITGGFSAFSSNGGGFASFANAGKSASFAEMLSSGEPEKPKPASPLAFGSTSSSKPSNASAFSTRDDPEVSTPALENSAGTISTRTARVEGSDSDDERKGSKNRVSEEKLANKGPSISSTKEDNPSPAPLQTTPSSIPRPEASSLKSENVSAATNTEEIETELEEEDTASEPFSLTEDGESVSEEVEQLPRSPTRSLSGEEDAHVSSQNTVQEQISQSTSTPELKNTRKASEVLSLPPKQTPPPSSVEEASTTPPGSPEKPVTIYQALPAPAAPTPILPASTISPFGLGLGRPSSRPIRSSPLASAPITSAGDDESIRATPSKSVPSTTKTKPLKPENTSEQYSQSAPVPSDTGDDTLTSKPRRPRTPPLLSTPPSVPGAMPPPPSSTIALGQSQISPTALKESVPSANPTSLPEAEEDDMPQHPMQVEFSRAYQDMTKELVQLRIAAQGLTKKRPLFSEPRGLGTLVSNNQDFIPRSHGDLKKMNDTQQKKVVALLEQGDANKRSLRDLQNLALISETKQEEVVRWVRARQDPDFARTLNSHALGPEHSENQTRLRKKVQMAQDRIQQCEDEMESLKKRLEQHKSGKFGIRPPSLDTIDRTYRNIQLALEERIKLLDQLHDRVENMSPKTSQRLQSTPPKQSPVSKSSHVTPPFASVAAAALNSERSSRRLKDALFTARKEPLLTTKITKVESSSEVGPDVRPLSQSQHPERKLLPAVRNSRESGLSKQEIEGDSEWDQEAERDYRRL